MNPDGLYLGPNGLLCPDALTAHALGVLEAPFPTSFDMSPTEDPKINMIFDLAGEDFRADYDLLWTAPIDIRNRPHPDRLAWAEHVLLNARTEPLRRLSPEDLLLHYLP